MSSDDFLEFDDDTQTQESSSGRNPFAILAGVLVTILILASICTVYLYSQRGQTNGEEVAAVETRNAEISLTNEAVTQTIVAMNAEASRPPTETPTPTPAIVDEPTETPTVPPTDTPVVQSGEGEDSEGDGETDSGDEGEGGEGEETETGDTVVDAEGTDDTATDTTDSDNSEGSTPEAAFDSTGTDSTLPQTGLDTWAAILLAVFFIGLFVAARRLRSS